ncbi:MAG: M48 family metallopeptidase [Pseudomonadota bacterium]
MPRLNAPRPERRVIDSIPVEVRRSARRRTRIGLAFDPGGYVIVETPLDAGSAEIQAVIRQHRRWLRHRLDQAAERPGISACLDYVSGDRVHYLGEPYELVVSEGTRGQVRLEQGESPAPGDARGVLRVRVPPHESEGEGDGARVRELLRQWYRHQALRALAPALEGWRDHLPWLGGRTPPWRHRYMRSQWGSCSRSGRISLNTHLVKTPPRLIAYVALHELCHLQHYDHGRAFYGLMSRYMPDWQQRRRELDQYLPVLMQD